MKSHIVFLQQVDHLLLEVGTIIRNNLIRDPVVTDDVVPDELSDMQCLQHRVRLGLNPLREVVYSYQNVLMPVGPLWSDSPNYINPLD